MENLKMLIKNNCRRGDKQQACRRSEVSRTVLENALKKDYMVQCTNGELRVLKALRDIIDEREQMLSTIQS